MPKKFTADDYCTMAYTADHARGLAEDFAADTDTYIGIGDENDRKIYLHMAKVFIKMRERYYNRANKLLEGK